MDSGQMLAHYRVENKIGAGGMGEVFRAHDTVLGRDVALKILPPDLATDRDRVARFQREAKVLASLHHPNIASIFGFETTPECTFLVMELVEGKDLSELLRFGALKMQQAIDIARQIAEGLEDAHEKGIVHRDLKPANVKCMPDGQVKLLDFGLAQWTEPATAGSPTDKTRDIAPADLVTTTGTLMGTVPYMSPEQARGDEVGKRSDIWALSVILYECLTGTNPFAGPTTSDTIAAILTTEVDLDVLPDELSPLILHALRRGLQKEHRSR
jgi:eukaryotic-like serine/threonine-protein kinase